MSRMKLNIACAVVFFLGVFSAVLAQSPAQISESVEVFTTYPFSDPDPVPKFSEYYPYYRIDGYATESEEREWKMITLKNDYITVKVLPEIGGKVWTAVENATGRPFLYQNSVIKFRDIAVRGPWTSGGIESNFGLFGHTPNCSTPVNYTMIERPDGSVSCVVGVLDLITRSNWSIDINLPKDKAYFTMSAFYQNGSDIQQPYYTWLNAAIKSEGDLEFVYPGTNHISHGGEAFEWPINPDNGKDISFFEENNFGPAKSYHIVGAATDFFGGYYHDDEFGVGRYSQSADKMGKKIFLWSHSEQGDMWEKLLTDSDGQYVEIQSGRLFNQSTAHSSYTPYKHIDFVPGTTDQWKEYWFPILETHGMVKANQYGALNLKNENGWLKVYFSSAQNIEDSLIVKNGDEIIYSALLNLEPLETFSDSINLSDGTDALTAKLGKAKLIYEGKKDLARPLTSPEDFDWESLYGLYLQGKEALRQQEFLKAEGFLQKVLNKDPYYVPALADMALVLFQRMDYEEALTVAKKAMSIDTYHPQTNYYYALINNKLGHIADAMDGLNIASLSTDYRSVAFVELAKAYANKQDWTMMLSNAQKAMESNLYNVDALQLQAIAYRKMNNGLMGSVILDSIEAITPLNEFIIFERAQWDDENDLKEQLSSLITSELPHESYLEQAIWYHSLGMNDEAIQWLSVSPVTLKTSYWKSYLDGTPMQASLKLDINFPFRPETAEVLKDLITTSNHWIYKYHLALIEWAKGDIEAAQSLYEEVGDEPNDAIFYASRAKFYQFLQEQGESVDGSKLMADLQQAQSLDKKAWRYGRDLATHYYQLGNYNKASQVISKYFNKAKDNYYLGLLYAKSLIGAGEPVKALEVLSEVNVLPNEWAQEGRNLYRHANLLLAIQQMDKQNWDAAMKYVKQSKKWPENLGVGKPFDDAMDERMEDYVLYLVLKQTDKKKAKELLTKLADRTSFDAVGRKMYSYFNDFITVKALEEVYGSEKAQTYLDMKMKSNPEVEALDWVYHAWKENEVQSVAVKDLNHDILSILLKKGEI